jgi:squalene synthase HpnC
MASERIGEGGAADRSWPPDGASSARTAPRAANSTGEVGVVSRAGTSTASSLARTTPLELEEETVLANATSENFPVALVVLPRAIKARLLAVYGFARLVDDIGDLSCGNRLDELQWLEEELERALSGSPTTHPVLRALARAHREVHFSSEPFLRLIEANRQDQVKASYASFDELVSYCTLSADPVGELVLQIFSVYDQGRVELSNHICTALQILEHLQDLREDARSGRIYLPREDLEHYGVTAAQLRDGPAEDAFRRLMAFEVGRARRLLREGLPLIATLRGYARLSVAGFAAGGIAGFEAIEEAGYDVLEATPRPGRLRLASHLARLLLAR